MIKRKFICMRIGGSRGLEVLVVPGLEVLQCKLCTTDKREKPFRRERAKPRKRSLCTKYLG